MTQQFSRRSALLQGGAFAAGVLATQLSGVAALAQTAKPLRRSLANLALNDPTLAVWREGVQKLKERPASNKVSWASFAEIHGGAAGFNRCPHGNWYFLPWHRAYLLMFEKAVRELTGQADFALPYWDWTAQRQLPAAFAQQTFAGKPNPLFEAQRRVRASDSLSDEIVGPAVMNRIYTEPTFETFGTTRPEGQNSLAASWISDGSGAQGELEGNPHNLVHGFVGGLMGSSRSARDPIFLMHHCNIDRIWAAWNAPPFNNLNSTDPLWTGMVFKDHFFAPDGSVYSAKVSDLFNPEALGYSYGLPAVLTASQPPSVVALGRRLESLVAAAPDVRSGVAGAQTFRAENATRAAASTRSPLSIPVEVDRALVRDTARFRRDSANERIMDFSAARAREAAGTRALAFLRDIDFKAAENTIYRVFIDCDYLTQTTPISDPHYVGSFGRFGEHAAHGRPTVALDLTQAIAALYGNEAEAPARIRVQLMPTPLRPGDAAGGTAAPQSVEVAFVSN